MGKPAPESAALEKGDFQKKIESIFSKK